MKIARKKLYACSASGTGCYAWQKGALMNNTTAIIPDGNVIIRNCENRKADTGIPWNNVSCLSVVVSFGDEIVTIFTKDGEVKTFDSDRMLPPICGKSRGSFRCEDEIQSIFGLMPEQFAEWSKRKHSGRE